MEYLACTEPLRLQFRMKEQKSELEMQASGLYEKRKNNIDASITNVVSV